MSRSVWSAPHSGAVPLCGPWRSGSVETKAPECGALQTLRAVRLWLCSLCVLSRPNLLFLLSCIPNFSLTSTHANPIRHTTLGRLTSRKLFRDDEAGHRAAGEGRGVLFHRRLSFDDFPL